jgi:hypothetical protein
MTTREGKMIRRASHALATSRNGETVVLDLKRGQYLTLNEVGGYVWERLASDTSVDSIVQTLRADFELPDTVSPADVGHDVSVLLDRLTAAGLIDHAARPSRRHGHKRDRRPLARPTHTLPSVLECTQLIAVIKLRLRFSGPGRTLRWIRRQVSPSTLSVAQQEMTVRDIERVVARACAWYPGRAECLERSLALLLLLVRRGITATFCMGVHPKPFTAHAWIEFRGTIVNDVPEYVERYARFPDIA